jgi:hypothetical protein
MSILYTMKVTVTHLFLKSWTENASNCKTAFHDTYSSFCGKDNFSLFAGGEAGVARDASAAMEVG